MLRQEAGSANHMLASSQDVLFIQPSELSSPWIYSMKSVNKFFHDKNSSCDVHETLPLYVKLIQSNVKVLHYKVNSSSQMWVGPATKWTHPIKCETVALQSEFILANVSVLRQ